ncbi:hypothetical protein [Bacillus cereus]|uniref:Uncharacterized protein n=1 Tax=Bacillus cereus (strain VD146) TaxID=1053236 RepID=R8MV37_BACCX|nr:hypothetical protein [Bacillus cereus]EOP38111.1 hypothetical protein IK1_02605 [Bacillus cereus VD146]
MRRKGYFIDNESKRLYNNDIVVSNKIYSNNPTLAELKQMINNGGIEEVFISDYFDD